jgi:ApaG protein
MKPSTNALLAFLTLAYPSSEAFTPIALSRTFSSKTVTVNNLVNIVGYPSKSNSSNTRLFSSVYDDEEDSDEEDSDDEDSDDDDDLPRSMQRSGLSTSFPKLDPYDPNPPIKPRPGRYGFQSIEAEMENAIPLSSLEQTMTPAQRQENLKIMRQIKNNDLADLRLRKDHAGWVDANNDLKARTKADPWFRVNSLIQEKYMLGEEEEVENLKKLAEKLGGPPPGVKVSDRGYALHTDIFDIGLSAARAQSALEESILQERVQRGRAMAAERRKNMEKEQQAWEDMLTNPGEREDKEAKERRERTMKRIMGEIEEEQKKREERAKEILGQLPELPTDNVSSLNSALNEAREDVKRLRKMRKEGRGLGEVSDDADLTFMNPEDRIKADSSAKPPKSIAPKGSAAKAREAAAAEAVGGRPRLPGDEDVTRGEITIPIESSSSTVSGPLSVEVSSSYNTAQSDPPMRKHCFQYTIRITNNSADDTIQLLSRRFEIQTVGSSMKDVVQGEGVTGRTPILKPGETFEYTSTAPLSVRPIATTTIAARMKGEYKYVTLAPGQETATEDQLKEGGNASAELGMFHFVFPEEQRVKPVVSYDEDDDDEEDEEDAKPVSKSDEKTSSSRPSSVSPPAASKASASPASTLPGDSDMASGNITVKISDASNVVSDNVRVQVSSVYRPERSDAKLDKHCFAYNVRITNESPNQNIQLVSRRFEIQTIGSETKDVVQGPGVTGRQPVLKPGESFEYTSTAPLSVKPMLDKTPVVARMEGEYNFVQLGDDGSTPLSSTPLKAKMEVFHFILPDLGTV